MNAVDTNILIYVHDPRDAFKQRVASELIIDLEDAVLLWQVACEFLSASRKLSALGYDFQSASDDIRKLASEWTTALPSWRILELALELLDRFSLSYWDALIVSACLEAGVRRLYTEDLGAPRLIDGLEIINPFLAGP